MDTGTETSSIAKTVAERIQAALVLAGLPKDGPLRPDQLGALDHYHTGGLAATRELLGLGDFVPGQRVLDIGAGLGGTARLLAAEYCVHVECLEPDLEFCDGARMLNELTGLSEMIVVRHTGVPPLPFDDATFDTVLMQNVGMFVADKAALFHEIARVLAPNGRYLFQEVARGTGDPYFPVPWAKSSDENYLAAPADLEALIEATGLRLAELRDVTEFEVARPISGAIDGPLTIATYVDGIVESSTNSRRSLAEGRIRLLQGCFILP